MDVHELHDIRDIFAGFVLDDHSLEVLRTIVVEFGGDGTRIAKGGVREAVTALQTSSTPKVLIIDFSESDNSAQDIDALANVCDLGGVVIAVGVRNDVRYYRDLLASGIQEYFLKPLQADVIAEALKEAWSVADKPERTTSNYPHISTAFIGTRGGVGATMLVSSVAWLLGTEHQRKTAVLDLDMYFGVCALAFDLEPGRGLIDAIKKPSLINTDFVERAVKKVSEQIAVVGAEAPLSQPFPRAEFGLAIAKFMTEMRASFDCTVIDLPRDTVVEHPKILQDLQNVVLVTEFSLAAARDTLRLISLVKAVASETNLTIVVNRREPSKVGFEIDRSDFEGVIERKVNFVLPFDPYHAAGARRNGKPLAEVAQGKPIWSILDTLSGSLIGVANEPEPVRPNLMKATAVGLLNRVGLHQFKSSVLRFFSTQFEKAGTDHLEHQSTSKLFGWLRFACSISLAILALFSGIEKSLWSIWILAWGAGELAHWWLSRRTLRALSHGYWPTTVLHISAVVAVALPWFWFSLVFLPTDSTIWYLIGLVILLMVGTFYFALRLINVTIYSLLLSVALVVALSRIGVTPELTGLVCLISNAACFGFASHHRLAKSSAADRDRLVENAEVLRLLLGQNSEEDGDWLWETDQYRCVVNAEIGLAVGLSLSVDTLNGTPLLKLLAGPDWDSGKFSENLHELAEKLKMRSAFQNLILPVTISGARRWLEVSGAPRFLESQFIGFRGVASDVTEQYHSAQKISFSAQNDAVTQLPHRARVFELLEEAVATSKRTNARCGLILVNLELDFFDSRPLRDQLLLDVVARLKRIMPRGAVLGRVGKDDFAIIVAEVDNDAWLETLAREAVEAARSGQLSIDVQGYRAAAGIAVGPSNGRTNTMLMRSAELALDRALEAEWRDGEPSTVRWYQPVLHQAAEERRLLEIELRKAIEREDFFHVYVPILTVEGELLGFEALLRWMPEEREPISPSKFIPIAEDSQLIRELGAWALRSACKEAAGWPESIGLTVNLSPLQLQDAGFLEFVQTVLEETGFQASRLTFEITESVFLRSASVTMAILEALLRMGVKSALDDFGTGYSSLGYLTQAPISMIKIDRSVVKDATAGKPASIAVVGAAVAIARSLGMACVAEGVETFEDLKTMSDLGCDRLQGYYFGRPLPASEVEQLITSHQHFLLLAQGVIDAQFTSEVSAK